MDFNKRTVRSRPGLSQEEALTSLQSHPLYRPGSRIASIRRRGDVWVADLLEPKTAGGFPPSDDGGEEESGPPKPEAEGPPEEGGEGGEPDGPPSDDGGEGGPPGEGGEKGKGGEKHEIGELLHLVQTIADALGIAPMGGPPMGGPDDLGPGMGGPEGPPPPHGGMGGPPPGAGGLPPGGPPKPGAAGIGAKLKPGEVPNKPGIVPTGAPAFASTRQAGPMGPSSVQVPIPGAPSAPTGAMPGAASHCPHGLDPAQCQACGGAAGAVQASRVASFNASAPIQRFSSLKQAKESLDAEFGHLGYKVKQIKRDGDTIHALLSVR